MLTVTQPVAWVVSTLAGSAPFSGSADGAGSEARFLFPSGVATDRAGNVYVGDTNNHTIRKITSAGMVSTLAGAVGQFGSVDGTGMAARFTSPYGVATDSVGNVLVVDYGNHTIRTISPTGVVSTLAGAAGDSGSADSAGSVARFYFPRGVATDSGGNVYVADTGNQTIRKITSAGVVSTLAGAPGQQGNTDSTGTAARFSNPVGVATDSAGNVYVGDASNHTIRKITSAGMVSTLAGAAGQFGSVDGTGMAARFASPYGVATDSVGNVFVADFGNYTIRKITSDGAVSTIAGTAGSGSGDVPVSHFYFPTGVATDSAGNVYVADHTNHTIRKVSPAAPAAPIISAQNPQVSGVSVGRAAALLWQRF